MSWVKADTNAIREMHLRGNKGERQFILPDDVPFLILPEGDSIIRIMPPIRAGYFGVVAYIHGNMGMDKNSFLCLLKTPCKKETRHRCFVCEEWNRLKALKASEDELSILEPYKRVLYNAVDMSKPHEGVKVWACPKTVASRIDTLCYNKRTKIYDDVSDPEKGYDIFITKTGTGQQTRYPSVDLDKEPTPIQNPAWLDQLFDIESMLIEPDEEDVKFALGKTGDSPQVSPEISDVGVDETERIRRMKERIAERYNRAT